MLVASLDTTPAETGSYTFLSWYQVVKAEMEFKKSKTNIIFLHDYYVFQEVKNQENKRKGKRRTVRGNERKEKERSIVTSPLLPFSPLSLLFPLPYSLCSLSTLALKLNI